MKMPSIVSNNPVLAGAAVLAVVGLVWLSLRGARGMGQDVGAGAVNFAAGVVGGAATAVVDNANDPTVNPLHGVGTTIGGALFDLFNDPVVP